MRLATINGERICECGHPASDHAEGYVCTHWLGDESRGYHGVCACIRDHPFSEAPAGAVQTPLWGRA